MKAVFQELSVEELNPVEIRELDIRGSRIIIFKGLCVSGSMIGALHGSAGYTRYID